MNEAIFYPLQFAMQIEAAMLEAITSRVPFTVVGFEPDGELIACVDMGEGFRTWYTF